jgi:hypothetical protein
MQALAVTLSTAVLATTLTVFSPVLGVARHRQGEKNV